jgi:hypothetical protein
LFRRTCDKYDDNDDENYDDTGGQPSDIFAIFEPYFHCIHVTIFTTYINIPSILPKSPPLVNLVKSPVLLCKTGDGLLF